MAGKGAARAAGRDLDMLRDAMPVLALAIVVLAVALQPDHWFQALPLVAAVGLFAGWAWWRVPIWLLTAGVVVTVVAVQPTSDLEIVTFLVSILAIVVGGWLRMGVVAWACVAAMVAAPVVVAWMQPRSEYAWPIWIAGILFPCFVSAAYHRQERTVAQLEATRRELEERAAVDERRQIARDVHDLVGHGLAAMMVQVSSARHVLRSEPDVADEALRTAEEVGRRSMTELRRTVQLLRRDEERPETGGLPGMADVAELVESVRRRGLDVEYEAGDPSEVDEGTGLSVYRVAQEALANAEQHAPSARTLVRTAVDGDAAVLTVDSRGPVHETDPTRLHFGLRGMRERAEVAGGTVSAGRSATGWLVECRIPLGSPRPSQPAAGGAAR